MLRHLKCLGTIIGWIKLCCVIPNFPSNDDHSMCMPVCLFLLPSPDDNLCLDYLHMTRTVYNDDYCTCGRVGVSGQTLSSLGIPDQGLEFERMTLTLRSNSNCSASGALVAALCIDDPGLERKKRSTGCNPTFISPQLYNTPSRAPPLVSSHWCLHDWQKKTPTPLNLYAFIKLPFNQIYIIKACI